MKKEVIIKRYDNYIVSALMEDGSIVEFDVKDQNETGEIGNIYIGKVKNIVANIHGAFIEIKDGQLCFYPLDEWKKDVPLKIDDEILVQIKREGSKEKKPLLTTNVEISGQYVVLTGNKGFVGVSNKIESKDRKKELKELCTPFVTKDYGFIIRTSAAHVEREIMVEEIEHLIERYQEMVHRASFLKPFSYVGSSQSAELNMTFHLYPDQIDCVITDDDEFEKMMLDQKYQVLKLEKDDNAIDRIYRMKHVLEEALNQRVWLKSGGFLVIEKTEAMYVVDVNSGKSIGKGKKENHIIKINREAGKEIARQMRLRNMSGIIMIDFIDMKKEESNEMLLREFSNEVKQDTKKVTVLDITRLGIMEVTRKKERVSLAETKLKNVLTDES